MTVFLMLITLSMDSVLRVLQRLTAEEVPYAAGYQVAGTVFDLALLTTYLGVISIIRFVVARKRQSSS